MAEILDFQSGCENNFSAMNVVSSVVGPVVEQISLSHRGIFLTQIKEKYGTLVFETVIWGLERYG